MHYQITWAIKFRVQKEMEITIQEIQIQVQGVGAGELFNRKREEITRFNSYLQIAAEMSSERQQTIFCSLRAEIQVEIRAIFQLNMMNFRING